jgi:hypothetical protein
MMAKCWLSSNSWMYDSSTAAGLKNIHAPMMNCAQSRAAERTASNPDSRAMNAFG